MALHLPSLSELRNTEFEIFKFQTRVVVLQGVVLLCFALLGIRLFYLQVVRHEDLLEQAMAASQQTLPTVEVIQQLSHHSVLGGVLASGWQTLHAEPRISDADLRASMEAAGRQAAHTLDKHLAALATIASAAPLLGLLGTVVGMIDIFGSQSVQGAAANPVQLAHGISMALYNTAFGLLIAIPALAAWRGLKAIANQRQRECEEFTRQLFKKLYSPNS